MGRPIIGQHLILGLSNHLRNAFRLRILSEAILHLVYLWLVPKPILVFAEMFPPLSAQISTLLLFQCDTLK
jgi:hypothetical protein